MDIKEQIAKKIFLSYCPTGKWDELLSWDKKMYLREADDIIFIPDIKEALSLLELKRQGKLVKLADDQSTPYTNENGTTVQRDMIANGFKRVEPL